MINYIIHCQFRKLDSTMLMLLVVLSYRVGLLLLLGFLLLLCK